MKYEEQKKMPSPGFEPGSSRPQREILTTILRWPGDIGYRSRHLSHAKRALYQMSYIPDAEWSLLTRRFEAVTYCWQGEHRHKIHVLTRLFVFLSLYHNKWDFCSVCVYFPSKLTQTPNEILVVLWGKFQFLPTVRTCSSCTLPVSTPFFQIMAEQAQQAESSGPLGGLPLGPLVQRSCFVLFFLFVC